MSHRRLSPAPVPWSPHLVVPLLLWLLAAPVAAEEGPAAGKAGPPQPGVEEIARCMRANLPEKTATQRVRFSTRDRAGAEQEVRSTVKWRRFGDGKSKVVVRVQEPRDLRGAGLLLVEKKSRSDMFLYLPELQKSRRVTSHMFSGSLFGSDFSYEDFEQLQGIAVEGRREQLPDGEVDGIPVWVVAQHPAPEAGSSYARVVSFIEKETCVPLKTEMWEAGERLRKVLTVDRDAVEARDGLRIPRELLMEDLLNQSRTRLSVLEIEVGVEIPRKEFSLSRLERPQVR